MTILIEGARTAEFLIATANGDRSMGVQAFDSTTDFASAEIPAGTVYAIVSDVAVPFDGDAVDGSEVAAGIVWEGIEADESVDRAVVVRDATVKRSLLVADGTDAETEASLLALGIVVRD